MTVITDVVDFEILPDYRIKVTLSNGKKGVFDVKPYLDRGIFTELKDYNYFRISHARLPPAPQSMKNRASALSPYLSPIRGEVFPSPSRLGPALERSEGKGPGVKADPQTIFEVRGRIAFGTITWPNEQDFSPETIEAKMERE